MKRNLRIKAFALLILMITDLVLPITSYALTGGPSQPEVQSFEPVGTSDMVDIFSGDFNYNIPLLDVNGYPINIAYHAGVSMDQEASWVGLGWNINPGSISRNLRGLPDDMHGDPLQYEKNQKDNLITGVSLGLQPELFGNINALKKLHENVNINVNLGLTHNNYKGISANLGAGLRAKEKSALANKLSAFNESSLSFGFASDGGISITPNISMNRKKMGFSVGSSFNTNGGVQTLNLGNTRIFNRNIPSASSFSFNMPQYTPSIKHRYISRSFQREYKYGPETYGVFSNLSLNVSLFQRKLASTIQNKRGFGYLYEKKRDSDLEVFDYSRENEGPVSEISPFLSWPNHTYDLYSISAQGTGGTYRLFRNDVTVIEDAKISSSSKEDSRAKEVGALQLFKGGENINTDYTFEESGGWSVDQKNNMLKKFGSKPKSLISNQYLRPEFENVYFKDMSELHGVENQKYNDLAGENGLKGQISLQLLPYFLGSDLSQVKNHLLNEHSGTGIKIPSDYKLDISNIFELEDKFYDFNNKVAIDPENGDFFNAKRAPRNKALTYFTAKQSDFCLNRHIISTRLNTKKIIDSKFEANLKPRIFNINQSNIDGGKYYSSENHISQIVQIQEDGSKYVFDIPAINHTQIDKQFRVHQSKDVINEASGIVTYGSNANGMENDRGIDRHYEGTFTPSYAHSYLLTGVLSPDYVDLTGDGITDDDLGSAVKFNYTRAIPVYHWRAPYSENSAKYSEGLKSDSEDDLGSYSYGTKEVWYLHSIEGKTHVALFSISKRNDGLGVLDENGGKDTSNKLYKLDKIELFSKRELIEFGEEAIPIKTVHFEYSYELCKGIENQLISGDGKLTLKEIYFTYGRSRKGKLNGYKFDYNNDDAIHYHINAYDRWGNYSPVISGPTNAEFPYVVQNKDSVDYYASLWNLSKIHLPSGGSIEVTYESDDYAYVQDNRAMRMFKLKGLGYKDEEDKNEIKWGPDIYDKGKVMDYLLFELESPIVGNPDAPRFIREHYFDPDQKYIQGTFYVNIKDDHYEYVKTYLEIAKENGAIDCGVMDGGQTGWVRIIRETVRDNDKGSDISPIAIAAFQFTRMNLDFIINPASRTITNEKSLTSGFRAIGSMFLAFINDLSNLATNPNRTLMIREFCKSLELNRSWIRLNDPDGIKYGGGHRVKRIAMSDAWNEINNQDPDAITSEYGQEYTYTTTSDGKQISSGVAQNEPSLGNDESPYVQPYFYDEKRRGVPDYRYTFEYPVLSSHLPGASVGYSEVRVESLHKHSQNKQNRTGYSIHEFYTAKDFPVKIDHSFLDPRNKLFFGNRMKLNPFSFGLGYEVALAQQGFRVITNDMHGKLKAQSQYSESNDLISGVLHEYLLDKQGELYNEVLQVSPNGNIEKKILGVNVELISDARKFKERSVSGGIGLNIDVFTLAIIPVPVIIPTIHGLRPSITSNNVYTSSTVKVVNKKGLLSKTTALKEGSKITTENLLYDDQTAEVLLTSVENEFGDKIYNFNYPAHWAYEKGMGMAFKNWGLEISGLKFNNGDLSCLNPNLAIKNYLVPGDKCLYKGTGDQIVWVHRALNDSLVLLTSEGQLINKGLNVSETNSSLLVLESGRKNMASIQIGSITTVVNPLHQQVGGGYTLSFTQVLTTSATEFSDEWRTDFDMIAEYQCDTVFNELYWSIDSAIGYIIDSTHWQFSIDNLTYLDTGSLFSDTLGMSNDSNRRLPWVNLDSCKQLAIQDELSKMSLNITDVKDSTFWFSNLYVVYNDNPSETSEHYEIKSHLNFGGAIGSFTTGHDPYIKVLFEDSYNIEQVLDLYFQYFMPNTYIVNCRNRDVLSNSNPNYLVKSTNIFQQNRTEGDIVLNNIIEAQNAIDNTFNSDSITVYGVGHDFTNGIKFYDIRFDDLSNCDIRLSYNTLQSSEIVRLEEIVERKRISDYEVILTTICELVNHSLYSFDTSYLDTVSLTINSLCYPLIECVPKCLVTGESESINPYLTGNRGNWRPMRNWTYIEDRNYDTTKADPRRDGTFKNFNPFWEYDGSAKYIAQSSDNKWVWTNTITEYSPFGMELENMDPLGRYSAVQYGFGQSLPVAVASNTKHRQLWYEGFEEYRYQHTLEDRYVCPPWRYPYTAIAIDLQDTSGFNNLDKQKSHSGSVSLKISSEEELVQEIAIVTNWVNNLSDPDTVREFISGEEHQIKSFSPPAGKYMISAWTHENGSAFDTLFENNRIIIEYEDGLSITGRDTIQASGLIIEGWQRMESSITIPEGTVLMRIRYSTLADFGWFDDLRIYPYNGSMKSYAYDERTLRLMAELDENNYATFYEYDLEGNLIRIKKETIEGIRSIQESRQHLKPQTP